MGAEQHDKVSSDFTGAMKEVKRALSKAKATSGVSITADYIKRVGQKLEEAELLFDAGLSADKPGGG